jgi:hypothetical protein
MNDQNQVTTMKNSIIANNQRIHELQMINYGYQANITKIEAQIEQSELLVEESNKRVNLVQRKRTRSMDRYKPKDYDRSEDLYHINTHGSTDRTFKRKRSIDRTVINNAIDKPCIKCDTNMHITISQQIDYKSMGYYLPSICGNCKKNQQYSKKSIT